MKFGFKFNANQKYAHEGDIVTQTDYYVNGSGKLTIDPSTTLTLVGVYYKEIALEWEGEFGYLTEDGDFQTDFITSSIQGELNRFLFEEWEVCNDVDLTINDEYPEAWMQYASTFQGMHSDTILRQLKLIWVRKAKTLFTSQIHTRAICHADFSYNSVISQEMFTDICEGLVSESDAIEWWEAYKETWGSLLGINIDEALDEEYNVGFEYCDLCSFTRNYFIGKVSNECEYFVINGNEITICPECRDSHHALLEAIGF